MPDIVTKPIVVTEATHARLIALRDAHDLVSFDRLIIRALDAFVAAIPETVTPKDVAERP